MQNRHRRNRRLFSRAQPFWRALLAALLIGGAGARAEDAAPPLFWRGLHAGVNFGYGLGARNAAAVRSFPLLNTSGYGPVSALGATGLGHARLDGVFAGGQIGYNWLLSPRFVLGVEADLQGLGLDGNGGFAGVTAPGGAPPSQAVTGATLTRNLRYLATARGRLGFLPVPDLMLYTTGGFAVGRGNTSLALEQALAPSGFEDAAAEGERNRTLTGFALGAGLERALGPYASARLEYLFYDLGPMPLGPAQIAPLAYRAPGGALALLNATAVAPRFSGHLLRAGVNYRFDWGRLQPSEPAMFAALPPPPPPEPAAAQEGDVEGNPLQLSPNNVERQLREGRADPSALAPFHTFGPIRHLWRPLDKRLQDTIGLDLGVNYTALYLSANRTLPDAPQNEAASGDFDFVGKLRMSPREERWPKSIYFATEWRHPFTQTPPGRLGAEIGSVWGLADGFNRQAYSLTELYWEHGSREDGVMYRAGRMKPSNIWNRGRFVSANHSFMNTTLSATPAMPLPGAGMGAAGAVGVGRDGYVLAGFHDANGVNNGPGKPELGEFFYALSLGVKRDHDPAIAGGHYFVTLWRKDRMKLEDIPSGEGVAFHVEQEVAPGSSIVPFARYSYGHGAGLRIRQSLALGVGFEAPFERKDERFGVAMSWAQPMRPGKPDQYGLEAFYRLMLTSNTQVTPDLQVIFDPADNPDARRVVIGGVRVRTTF